MAYSVNKLVNAKRTSDGGYQCQCPACARMGRDLKGKNHLRIYKSGAFNCAVDNSGEHNSSIKSLLGGGDGGESDVEYLQPESPKIDVVYPDSILDKLIPDYSYWAGRGISVDVVKSLECGLVPQDEQGPLSGRTVFPLRNPDGKITAFTARLVVDNSFGKKWIHLKPVSRVVWPWRVSGPEIERTKTAILVESPGDTLALLSRDIKPVICLFGLNLFDLTVGTLIGAGVTRVFVSPNRDADPRKGQAAADKIARKLSPFISDVRIRLPNAPFKDWGDCAKGGEAGAAELAAFKEEISHV